MSIIGEGPRLVANPSITMNATLRLSHEELAALNALAGYSTDDILSAFSKFLGDGLGKHRRGFTSLFEVIRREVPTLIKKLENAEAAFKDTR